MSQTIQIFLNSSRADEYYNGFTTECLFVLPHIVLPKRSEYYLSVENAQIPCSWFNVDYYNNTLIYSVNGGVDVILEIPESNYNANTLKSYLSGAMTGFTITYDSASNKYTFTNSQNFEFKSDSTCMEVLGFTESVNHISTALTLTSDNVINFFTIKNILIQSENVITYNINNFTPNVGTVLASIPVVGGSYSVLAYSNYNNLRSSISSVTNFTRLKVKLTDHDGDILDLNGTHWTATLVIWIE